MPDVDVRKVVDVHFVIPESTGEFFDAHTHGLEAFGHPEFQVLVPGYCRRAALELLLELADAVINRGSAFRPGDTIQVFGVACGFEEVDGDVDGDPNRLRVVDIPGSCKCELCQLESGRQIDGPAPTDGVRPEPNTDISDTETEV